ncbi:MAG: hypothetical protein KDH90_07945, partial [Anaerolineae bacterium]|nr:hypothetical protein [Anaerolineae bacterium]
MQLARVIGTL